MTDPEESGKLVCQSQETTSSSLDSCSPRSVANDRARSQGSLSTIWGTTDTPVTRRATAPIPLPSHTHLARSFECRTFEPPSIKNRVRAVNCPVPRDETRHRDQFLSH